MTKLNKKFSQGKTVWLTIAGLFALTLIVATMLRGADVALLNSKGLISGEQRRLLIFVTLILLQIGIPSLIIFYFVAWKYRESNTKATYNPRPRHGKYFVFSLWAIPSFFALMIGLLLIPATYKLEPQKAINSDKETLRIQVVALRWKWLFIYPDQKIATVNYVQIPVDTPVRFELTADEAPMSSFWIPHLGGQLYAMTGHVNSLNLLAEQTGDYPGSSAEINGIGFSGMRFTTRVSTEAEFDKWLAEVRESKEVLHAAKYESLLAPSQRDVPVLFSSVDSAIVEGMIAKYEGSHKHTPNHQEHE